MRLIKIVLLFYFPFLFACNQQSETSNEQVLKQRSELLDSVQTNADPIDDKAPKKVSSNAEILTRPQIPVICYHRIRESDKSDAYSVSEEQFKEQLQTLVDSGYTAINPDQLYAYLAYGTVLPAKPVLITFDDNRIEQFEIAAPELEKHQMYGTFFIMTITIGKKNYMNRTQIKVLADHGHTIGCHSWDHHDARKYTDPDWQKQSIDQQALLAAIIGKQIDYWAYPFGLNNQSAAATLSKYYKLSFILAEKRIPDYPLQTVRRILVPYGWSGKRLLKAMQSSF